MRASVLAAGAPASEGMLALATLSGEAGAALALRAAASEEAGAGSAAAGLCRGLLGLTPDGTWDGSALRRATAMCCCASALVAALDRRRRSGDAEVSGAAARFAASMRTEALHGAAAWLGQAVTAADRADTETGRAAAWTLATTATGALEAWADTGAEVPPAAAGCPGAAELISAAMAPTLSDWAGVTCVPPSVPLLTVALDLAGSRARSTAAGRPAPPLAVCEAASSFLAAILARARSAVPRDALATVAAGEASAELAARVDTHTRVAADLASGIVASWKDVSAVCDPADPSAARRLGASARVVAACCDGLVDTVVATAVPAASDLAATSRRPCLPGCEATADDLLGAVLPALVEHACPLVAEPAAAIVPALARRGIGEAAEAARVSGTLEDQGGMAARPQGAAVVTTAARFRRSAARIATALHAQAVRLAVVSIAVAGGGREACLEASGPATAGFASQTLAAWTATASVGDEASDASTLLVALRDLTGEAAAALVCTWPQPEGAGAEAAAGALGAFSSALERAASSASSAGMLAATRLLRAAAQADTEEAEDDDDDDDDGDGDDDDGNFGDGGAAAGGNGSGDGGRRALPAHGDAPRPLHGGGRPSGPGSLWIPRSVAGASPLGLQRITSALPIAQSGTRRLALQVLAADDMGLLGPAAQAWLRAASVAGGRGGSADAVPHPPAFSRASALFSSASALPSTTGRQPGPSPRRAPAMPGSAGPRLPGMAQPDSGAHRREERWSDAGLQRRRARASAARRRRRAERHARAEAWSAALQVAGSLLSGGEGAASGPVDEGAAAACRVHRDALALLSALAPRLVSASGHGRALGVSLACMGALRGALEAATAKACAATDAAARVVEAVAARQGASPEAAQPWQTGWFPEDVDMDGADPDSPPEQRVGWSDALARAAVASVLSGLPARAGALSSGPLSAAVACASGSRQHRRHGARAGGSVTSWRAARAAMSGGLAGLAEASLSAAGARGGSEASAPPAAVAAAAAIGGCAGPTGSAAGMGGALRSASGTAGGQDACGCAAAMRPLGPWARCAASVAAAVEDGDIAVRPLLEAAAAVRSSGAWQHADALAVAATPTVGMAAAAAWADIMGPAAALRELSVAALQRAAAGAAAIEAAGHAGAGGSAEAVAAVRQGLAAVTAAGAAAAAALATLDSSAVRGGAASGPLWTRLAAAVVVVPGVVADMVEMAAMGLPLARAAGVVVAPAWEEVTGAALARLAALSRGDDDAGRGADCGPPRASGALRARVDGACALAQAAIRGACALPAAAWARVIAAARASAAPEGGDLRSAVPCPPVQAAAAVAAGWGDVERAAAGWGADPRPWLGLRQVAAAAVAGLGRHLGHSHPGALVGLISRLAGSSGSAAAHGAGAWPEARVALAAPSSLGPALSPRQASAQLASALRTMKTALLASMEDAAAEAAAGAGPAAVTAAVEQCGIAVVRSVAGVLGPWLAAASELADCLTQSLAEQDSAPGSREARAHARARTPPRHSAASGAAPWQAPRGPPGPAAAATPAPHRHRLDAPGAAGAWLLGSGAQQADPAQQPRAAWRLFAEPAAAAAAAMDLVADCAQAAFAASAVAAVAAGASPGGALHAGQTGAGALLSSPWPREADGALKAAARLLAALRPPPGSPCLFGQAGGLELQAAVQSALDSGTGPAPTLGFAVLAAAGAVLSRCGHAVSRPAANSAARAAARCLGASPQPAGSWSAVALALGAAVAGACAASSAKGSPPTAAPDEEAVAGAWRQAGTVALRCVGGRCADPRRRTAAVLSRSGGPGSHTRLLVDAALVGPAARPSSAAVSATAASATARRGAPAADGSDSEGAGGGLITARRNLFGDEASESDADSDGNGSWGGGRGGGRGTAGSDSGRDTDSMEASPAGRRAAHAAASGPSMGAPDCSGWMPCDLCVAPLCPPASQAGSLALWGLLAAPAGGVRSAVAEALRRAAEAAVAQGPSGEDRWHAEWTAAQAALRL